MFCRKCGQQINGNPKFCSKCGAPIAAQGGTGSTTGNEVPKKNIPYLAIGAIAAAAIVVIILLFFIGRLFFGGGYKTPVKNYMKAIEKQDAKLLLKTIPKDVLKELQEETGMDMEDITDEIEDVVSRIADEYDGKVKIKYEIEDEHKLKKSEIKDIERELFKSVDIKEGKELEISAEIYIDGKEEDDSEFTLNVIKVGRKWYLDPSSFGF